MLLVLFSLPIYLFFVISFILYIFKIVSHFVSSICDAASGKKEAVETLIELGANKEAADRTGTAIHIAACTYDETNKTDRKDHKTNKTIKKAN